MQIYTYVYCMCYTYMYIHIYIMRYICMVPPAWILDRSIRGTGRALALSPDGARGGWEECSKLAKTGPNYIFNVLNDLKQDQIACFKSLICAGARRNLSTRGTNQGDDPPPLRGLVGGHGESSGLVAGRGARWLGGVLRISRIQPRV